MIARKRNFIGTKNHLYGMVGTLNTITRSIKKEKVPNKDITIRRICYG